MFRLSLFIALFFCCTTWAETVIWGSNQTLPLDGPLTNVDSETLAAGNLLYDSLFAVDHEGELTGRLVERWERLSPTLFRLTLRQGVHFHSGNPLTADDVVWSFVQHLRSPSFAAYFAVIKSIEVVDSDHLLLKLDQPVGSPLRCLTNLFVYDRVWQIQSRNFQIHSTEHLLASGSGPFILKEHQQGIRSRLVRNPDYWGASTGNIDSLVIVPILNPVARLMALTSGDVDIVNALLPEHFSIFNKMEGYEAKPIDATNWIGLSLNMANPLLQIPSVRHAIEMAIDRVDITNYLFEFLGHSAYQLKYTEQDDINFGKQIEAFRKSGQQLSEYGNMFYAGLSTLNRKIEQSESEIDTETGTGTYTPYEPHLARELLIDLDLPADLQLELIAPSSLFRVEHTTKLLQQMLFRVNINLQINLLDDEDYKLALRERRGDLFIVKTQGKRTELFGRLQQLAVENSFVHCPDSGSGAIWADLNPMEPFMDSADYMKHLESALQTIQQQRCLLPLYWQPELWGVNQRLSGLSLFTGMAGLRFDLLSIEQAEDFLSTWDKDRDKRERRPESEQKRRPPQERSTQQP